MCVKTHMNMYIEHTHTCVHTHSHMHTHSKEENTMSDHFNIKSIKYLGITNTYCQTLPQNEGGNTSQSIMGGICK